MMVHHCGGLQLLVLLGSVCVLAIAQLSREERQLFLDLHNYHRASVNAANMRRLVSTKPLLGACAEDP